METTVTAHTTTLVEKETIFKSATHELAINLDKLAVIQPFHISLYSYNITYVPSKSQPCQSKLIQP